MHKSGFLTQKRNLFILGVWCVCVLLLVAGVTYNAALYSRHAIEDTEVYRRLWYALICFAAISLLPLAERWLRFRLPLPLELAVPLYAFLALAAGSVFDLYRLMPGYDKLMQAFGGALFSAVGLCLTGPLFPGPKEGERRVGPCLFFSLCFALSLCLLWETAEFAIGAAAPGFLQAGDRADSALDMLSAFGGAALFLLALLIPLLREPRRLLPFTVERIPRKARNR